MTAHDTRVRFVVLASPRSGSNHLISLVRQHPRAEVFYELLHNLPGERSRWVDGKSYDGHEPVEAFLDRIFEAPYRRRTRAVGFKLFYAQASTPALYPAWRHLSGISGLRVVEIVRDNVLRQCVSLEVASQSNRWAALKTDGPIAPVEVDLSPARFLDFLARQASDREEARARLAGKERLEVTYEALAANRDAVLTKVFSFLGLRSFPHRLFIREQLRKQGADDVRMHVRNYAELESYFRGRPEWRYFDK